MLSLQIIFTTPSPLPLMRQSEVGFLADECVWRSLVVALREGGFVCEWIPDLVPSIADRDVLALSVARRRILITEDGDFGELIFRQDLPAYGVLRIRLSQYEGEKEEVAKAVVLQIVEIAGDLSGFYTTMEPKRLRRRALPVRLDHKD